MSENQNVVFENQIETSYTLFSTSLLRHMKIFQSSNSDNSTHDMLFGTSAKKYRRGRNDE